MLWQPRSQPANLAAVIDLVFGDVEPAPVCVQAGRNAQRSLEPVIVALRQYRQGGFAGPCQLVGVELQVVPPDLAPPLVAELQRGERGGVFRSGRLTLLERDDLVAALHGTDMGQQRANGV